MKVVIDSNRVIAALIKDSITREIISSKDLDFIAPDHQSLTSDTNIRSGYSD